LLDKSLFFDWQTANYWESVERVVASHTLICSSRIFSADRTRSSAWLSHQQVDGESSISNQRQRSEAL